MGGIVDSAVNLGTFGLVDDFSGTQAAQDAATQGNAAAMQAQERMYQQGLDFQKEQWDWQKQQSAPWQAAGQRGLSGLESRMGQAAPQFGQVGGFNQPQDNISLNMPSNFNFQFDPSSDPVYQARLQEQSKAFGASGASKGMQLSGKTLRGLSDITANELGSSYGRQYQAATDQYGRAMQQSQLQYGADTDAYGRAYGAETARYGRDYGAAQDQYQRQYGAQQDDLNRWASLAGVGQTATSGLQQLGQGFSQNVGGMMSQQGSNLAQGYMNQGQIGAQAAMAPFNNLMSLGQTGASMYAASDIRLKDNIEQIGNLTDELPIYKFNYIWDTTKQYIGLMAQEVEKVLPDAVIEVDGYKAVNYTMVMENI